MKNIVSIDPSLSCTAMIVNNKKFIYTNSNIALTKKLNLNKWFAICEDHITYRLTDYTRSKIYSDQEILKLTEYNTVTDKIIVDITDNLNPGEEIFIAIEGYSQSSSAGPLIDLVTFSTLLRNKLIKISNNLEIISPSSLKLEAAKMTYPVIEKGKRVKKYEWRNHEGIAGGKFTKIEMLKSLIENNNLHSDPWVKLLLEYKDELLSVKKIQKPIEDMNDAKILYEYVKNK